MKKKKKKRKNPVLQDLIAFFMADKRKKHSFGLCIHQKTVFVASQKLFTLMNVLENHECTRDISRAVNDLTQSLRTEDIFMC